MFQAGKVTGKRLKTRISMVQLGAMNIWMWMQHKVVVLGLGRAGGAVEDLASEGPEGLWEVGSQ